MFTVCLAFFTTLRPVSMVAAPQQKKIIVYNVAKYQAMGVVVANTYHFIGDPALLFDDFIRNFHIQPSGIANRLPRPGERPSVAKTLILPINL